MSIWLVSVTSGDLRMLWASGAATLPHIRYSASANVWGAWWMHRTTQRRSFSSALTRPSVVHFCIEHHASIIVQKQFWEQIPDELKAKIEVAALDAAQAERKESIEDIDTVKARAAEDSIEVITMSPEERARFKEATAYIAPKFAGMFSDGLVAAISSTA